MTITLASLNDALLTPFPVDAIRFLPKSVREDHGKTVCTAFPYANKRVYEDRLNAIACGEWETPFIPPCVAGNRLIVPVTVVICGVPHTDYGEAFLAVPGKGGTTRDDENTATEAYSQAFRRACSQFGLGRYLYNLSKVTLPFNPKTRQIALSESERIAWVEKLYAAQHLLPAADPIASTRQQEQAETHAQPQKQHTASVSSQKDSSQPVQYPNNIFLDWVATQVNRDATRIQGICHAYRVNALAQLTEPQREDLTKRLQHQARKAATVGTAVSRVSTPVATATSSAR